MTASDWLSVGAVILSAIAILVSVKSWHKNRTIYGLEELVLRRINGSKDDGARGIEDINKKLQTGKYTVQGIQDRVDGDWAVILAQIKKIELYNHSQNYESSLTPRL